MTVIEALHSYFKTSPALADVRLDIDCLQRDPAKFSLDSIPGERILKKYIDGSSVRRQLFTISSRTPYGPDLAQQTTNLDTFGELEDWLDSQEQLGILPPLGNNRKARSLRVTSSAYPIEVDEGQGVSTARYQIQLELIYLQNIEYQEDIK